MPPDIADDLGLAGLAALLHSGEIKSEAVTQDYLDRIERLDPAIGSYFFVNPNVLKDAREIDRKRSAGIDLGPLMGVPIAIKQIFSVTGFPSSPASAIDVRRLIPAQGPFVEILKRAGAVILGLTRTTEFAAATINTTTPTPWNPWDVAVKRVCGGSSHGSAAAQAAGLCAFAIGSDTGGSVRLPAALCGVVGFKPTRGRWPIEGVFTLSPTFDTVGIFANSAQDIQFICDSLDTLRIATSASKKELKFACPREFNGFLDPSVRAAFDRSLERLQAAGVTIVPIDLPEVAEVASVFGRILPAELIDFVGRECIESNHDKLDPVVWARITAELQTSPIELDQLRQRHIELTSTVRSKVQEFDAIIGPTSPIAPTPAAELAKPEAAIEWNRVSASFTRPGNLFGMCGISLPVISPTHLPAGIQLLCLAGQDERLIALAGYVESVLGRCKKPDVSEFVRHEECN